MIVYEVNLTIDSKIENECKSWLKKHVAEMLKFDGFQSAEIFEDENREQTVCRLVVQYKVSSRDNLQNYLDNHSTRMREEGARQLGNQFTATRRILTVCGDS